MTEVPIMLRPLLAEAFPNSPRLRGIFEELARALVDATNEAQASANGAAPFYVWEEAEALTSSRILSFGAGLSASDDGSTVTVTADEGSINVEGGYGVTFVTTGETELLLPTTGQVATILDIGAVVDMIAAVDINFTPAGNIAATNVQAAIEELDAEKQPLDGDLTSLSAAAGTNTIYYRSAADTWSPVTIGGMLDFTGGTLNVGDAQLVAIAGLTPAANEIIYWTGATTAAMTSFTASARSFAALNVVLGDLVMGTSSGHYNLLPASAFFSRYLGSSGGGIPSWQQIDLTAGVTGDLPFANLTQGSALSVLGVAGNATADVASIAAGSDGHVLRRSGTTLGFGTVPASSISSGAALTRVDDTNVTLTLGGTPATALLAATSLTLGWTGTLAVSRGGTGGGAASGTLLDNITGFASTGVMARTGSGTYAFRTITGTANEISVADGNGVSANPTLSLPSAITLTGKTVTGLSTADDASLHGITVGTGGQTNGTVVGGTVSAAAGCAIGSGSSAAGSATAVGRLASATTNAVAIGLSSVADATNSLAIGHSANVGGFASYCIGRASTATAANQCVIGSDSTAITNVFFGRGVVSATTTAVTINGTGGSGTDIAGGNLTIAGGRCTGAGTEGKIIFSTAATGSTGTTLRSLTQRAEITSAGINIASGHALLVNGTQVVAARKTGWTAATGTAQRTGFATYTAAAISNPPTQAEVQAIANALQDISRTGKAIVDDLHATAGHGLFGA